MTVESDPLAPARGCLIGVAMGLAIWTALVAGYLVVSR